jgi:hypothetical protein
MIDLGTFLEPIRWWLFYGTPYPPNVFLSIGLDRPEKLQMVFSPPSYITSPEPTKRFMFFVLGARFFLELGESVEPMWQATSFSHNPRRPIFVCDTVTNQHEYKFAKEFFEARKTKAYLQSIDKFRKSRSKLGG